MRVIVVNSGSSSIKYEVFVLDGCTSVVRGLLERIGTRESRFKRHWLNDSGNWEEYSETRPIADHREGFQFLLDVAVHHPTTRVAPGAFFGFGHRVVHGGEAFHEPVIIDDEVIRRIKDLIPLAPLHNPANLVGIEVLRALRPDIPNVAVFDTAFHQTMPPVAFHYATPYDWYAQHHVRRYGFHGTSHHYVAKEAAKHLGKAPERLNLITLHLGNGASAAAVRQGKSIDTSMGLTPLEGLVMGTRCGDIDPALHFFMMRETGMTADQLEESLNSQGGLKGICGLNDMREIVSQAESGNDRAKLAIEMFCYRTKKYIGAYLAVLGNVDAIVFTGGIGENAPVIRERVCEGLEHLGIAIDVAKNEASLGGVTEIHKDGAPLRILVVRTDEELEIAIQTINTIKKAQ